MRFAEAGSDKLIAVVLGTQMLLAGPANAETIYLTCSGSKISVTLDLGRRTANNSPARINQTTIDWSEPAHITDAPGGHPSGAHGTTSFHLDRVTGNLTTNANICFPNGKCINLGGGPYACSKTTAPPTKF